MKKGPMVKRSMVWKVIEFNDNKGVLKASYFLSIGNTRLITFGIYKLKCDFDLFTP